MRQWLPNPRLILTSAPFMVFVGMSTLILGGLAGAAMLDNGEDRNMSVAQSGFMMAETDTDQHSSKALLHEVESAKKEADSILSNNPGTENSPNINMMGYFEASSQQKHRIRRDPFSPIRPVAQIPAINNEHMARGSKVTAPGDSNNPA